MCDCACVVDVHVSSTCLMELYASPGEFVCLVCVSNSICLVNMQDMLIRVTVFAWCMFIPYLRAEVCLDMYLFYLSASNQTHIDTEQSNHTYVADLICNLPPHGSGTVRGEGAYRVN